ncbi:MAG: DUF2267 domain-containing protein [Ignavibacteriae bacterium]|nr:MAG: DUF2267 domain-containing protein [Ignavibacteriota bacterium]
MSLNFDDYAQKGNEILRKIAEEMGEPGNKDKAGRVLRASLHALRKRLPAEESMQFIAQLPMALKSVYVDGWKLRKEHEKIKKIEHFMSEVQDESSGSGFVDFPTLDETQRLTMCVFRVLKEYVSAGEMEDIKSVLPEELKQMFGVSQAAYK